MNSGDIVRRSDPSHRFCFLVVVAALLYALPDSAFAGDPSLEVLSFVDVPNAGTIAFSPTERETSVPEQFQLKAHEFPFKTRPWFQNARVRTAVVTFPSPVETAVPENNTVHAEYFQPSGKGPYPACVVLHILGGDFLLSRTIANQLAQHGVAALFVKLPYYGERRSKNSPRRMISRIPTEAVEGMTQGVLDIRRAAAWLSARPEVDAERLGITGISLGGIMTALSASAEPRFKNVAIYLGGGNLSKFLWANPDPQAQEFRRKWLGDGRTKEDLDALVGKVDPVTYGHLLKGRRVLMVVAKNDEVVSPESGLALWESMGREPKLVWLNAGHYSAVKYLPRELVRMDLFFNGSQ